MNKLGENAGSPLPGIQGIKQGFVFDPLLTQGGWISI